MDIVIAAKAEAIDWIHSLKTLGIKPGLARMEWMLGRLGHPERRLKFIHIAGTNGKGSTVSFISQVLKKSGYCVGTYTSPYLISFTDRIKVNGVDISDDDLVAMLNKIIPLAGELEKTELGAPTEFEVITTLAILYFAESAYPDVVVWETGLGGRLDSTNVVLPLVSVITNVSYDHMNLLGNDIKDIAKEKAGIIKPGIPVVSAVENLEALNEIREIAKLKKAKLYQLDEQFHIKNEKLDRLGGTFDFVGPYLTMPDIEIKMIGPHQLKNAATSLMTLEILRQFYAFYIDEEAIYSGMRTTFWPGRFELLNSNPTIIIDGAHNPDGAKNLKETVKLYDYKRLIVVTGILNDKAIEDFFKELLPVADQLILTKPDFHRAAEPAKLVDIIRNIDNNNQVTVIEDWKTAVNTSIAIASRDDLILYTGSLYLISDIRHYLSTISLEVSNK